MAAILSLLVVLVLSVFVNRFATVARSLTGMSTEAARFQARSALTGAGFTTMESEQIVGHPVRRRIISTLMLLGNLGVVAVSSTLIISVIGIQDRMDPVRISVFVAGIVGFYFFARSAWIEKVMTAVSQRVLRKYTTLETRDFTTLLHLRRGYRIAEVVVEFDDWMNGKTLKEMRLADHGLLVLGAELPHGEYEGAPGANFTVEVGQTLIVYGLPEMVEALDRRCVSDPPEKWAALEDSTEPGV